MHLHMFDAYMHICMNRVARMHRIPVIADLFPQKRCSVLQCVAVCCSVYKCPSSWGSCAENDLYT